MWPLIFLILCSLTLGSVFAVLSIALEAYSKKSNSASSAFGCFILFLFGVLIFGGLVQGLAQSIVGEADKTAENVAFGCWLAAFVGTHFIHGWGLWPRRKNS